MPRLYQEADKYTLKCGENCEGEIVLVIVDGLGNQVENGTVLKITSYGELSLPDGVDKIAAQKAGIQLTEVSGRIASNRED